MNKRNFYLGMGMGLVVGSAAACMMKPKKHCAKNSVGKALRAMGDVAESISGVMGW